MSAFVEGLEARKVGVDFDAFPEVYLERVSKLGTRVANEAGQEWQAGWNSFKRFANKQELAAAEAVDVSKFRKKGNRYYA